MTKFVTVALLALAGSFCLAQSNQKSSVAEAARAQRAKEQAAPNRKVWTNDDFPDKPATPSAEAPPADANANPPAAEPGKDADAARDDKKEAKATPADDQSKLDAEWKSKIDSQKSKIADLQREYDLTDREFKLSATSYYADAGNRLRDQKDFHDKEAAYRDKLASLKQQIDDEKSKLSDLQDQAHKAGANKAYD